MKEDEPERTGEGLREQLDAALKRRPRSAREFTEQAAREKTVEREPDDDNEDA